MDYGPHNATLTVHTKRAGAAAKAGHDLTILVERWSATLADGDLSFEPALPRLWRSLSFSLRFRNRQVRVRLAQDEETYFVEEGGPLEITVRGERHLLTPGSPVTIQRAPRARQRHRAPVAADSA